MYNASYLNYGSPYPMNQHISTKDLRKDVKLSVPLGLRYRIKLLAAHLDTSMSNAVAQAITMLEREIGASYAHESSRAANPAATPVQDNFTRIPASTPESTAAPDSRDISKVDGA